MTTHLDKNELTQQHAACLRTGGFLERTDRGLIEVTGNDRGSFLQNLTTNQVANLQPGEGNYVFSINIKGRVVFDAVVLVQAERILLDIDARWVEPARAWLDRYHITEDVKLVDYSEEHRRIAIFGPQAGDCLQALEFGKLMPMAWYQNASRTIQDADVTVFRQEQTGLIGAEFIILDDRGGICVERLLAAARAAGLEQVHIDTLNALRIEAGIPASVVDIDEEVVPPETGQIERGISYQKGCYLGQEVIERMRARGVLPRKLVGVRYDAADAPPPNTPLVIDNQTVGRSMSATYTPTLQTPLALAYLKSAHAQPDTTVTATAESQTWTGTVVKLPIRK